MSEWLENSWHVKLTKGCIQVHMVCCKIHRSKIHKGTWKASTRRGQVVQVHDMWQKLRSALQIEGPRDGSHGREAVQVQNVWKDFQNSKCLVGTWKNSHWSKGIQMHQVWQVLQSIEKFEETWWEVQGEKKEDLERLGLILKHRIPEVSSYVPHLTITNSTSSFTILCCIEQNTVL